VRGVDMDPVRRSLIAAVVAFSADTGATVVAEGIETRGELRTLVDLGVSAGQGYLLGRPAAPEALCHWHAPPVWSELASSGSVGTSGSRPR
ncbi:MAG: EAL domain-containing protein, partial [Acidimicrobiales bacterium]